MMVMHTPLADGRIDCEMGTTLSAKHSYVAFINKICDFKWEDMNYVDLLRVLQA
jgi:hypothetical protein